MKKLIILLSFIPLFTYAQYDYELGYWESDFWKKTLKKHASPNGEFTVLNRDGSLRYSGEFRDGTPYGDWVVYRYRNDETSSQTVKMVTNYNGEHTEYQWNGKDTLVSGQYKNGQPFGSWYHFRTLHKCDSVFAKILSEYNYESNNLTSYSLQNHHWRYFPENDTIIGSVGMPMYLKKHTAEPEEYFSLDASYHRKEIDMDNLNKAFRTNTNQSFNPEIDILQFAFLMSSNSNSHWSLGFSLSGTDSIVTDSVKYTLRAGNSVHLKYAFDLIKDKRFEFSPYAGIGLNFSKLTYAKNKNLYPDLDPFDDIFSPSANSTTHPSSDPYSEIDFTSDELVLNLGLKASWHIPLSKSKYQGLKIGGEAGYMYAPFQSQWEYTIEDVQGLEEADFIPTINATGFYYGFTIGFFGFYQES